MSEKLKIKYVMNLRLPTEKAHGIQIMKTCEAFANLGHDVELVIPKKETSIKDDPFDYYRVKKNFKIKRLGYFGATKLDKLGFFVTALTFALSVVFNIPRKGNIFYTRDKSVGFVLKITGYKVIWEDHMGHANTLVKFLLASRMPIVVITEGLRSMYLKLGAKPDLIFVASDGVDIDQFNIPETRLQARQKLGFKADDRLVVYTGHLYEWKGADTLARAMSLIKGGVKVLFVGGTENDIALFKNKYGGVDSIYILGKKPHSEMPLYMRSADVLVLPNSAKEEISRFYTSPMKLFEYMASGTPIVASDLPSIREVLDEKSANFFLPDSSESLAKVIMSVLEDESKAKNRSSLAMEKVKEYSWERRAEKIIGFMNSL